MIVLDSSIWIELFTSGSNAHKYEVALNDFDSIIVPTPCLYETKRVLDTRFPDDNYITHAISLMRSYFSASVDDEIALSAAALPSSMSACDRFIYACAIKYGAELWTQDIDFKGLDNVRYFPKN